MSLEEYRRKRDTGATPEPGTGGDPGAGEQDNGLNRFVIHKHDATRHHYDLRLEHDGVLKSWALPKGLATPHDSRKLAVRVEDHPLEYLDFSGEIPAGEYGAGQVDIWDRGTYTPLDDPEGALARGKLTVRLGGDRIRGEYALVQMKPKSGEAAGSGKAAKDRQGREWLVILAKKERLNPDLGAEGEAAPMPGQVKPMLAMLSDEPFDSRDHIFEIKFDGVRAISYIDASGRLSIMSRNQKEQAFRYPEFAEMNANFLASELVVDGEIVAADEQGASRFQLLQSRLNLVNKLEIESASRSTPAFYYVFDLLYLDGRDITYLPLTRRKELLARVMMPDRRFRLSDWYEEHGKAMFAFARDHGLEGVIAKMKASPYRHKRSRDWLKIKAVRQQEFVIGGYTEPRGGRPFFGALLLGLYEGDDLVYSGHVGTGFSDDTLKGLHTRLSGLEQDDPPFRDTPKANEAVHWVRPELVAEVRFSEWTGDGLLRQPVFLGLREDIDPRDCVREEEQTAAAGADIPETAAAGPGEPRLLDPLELSEQDELRLSVGGREVHLSNLDKVFWPREDYTKADLIDYYHRVSDFIVPHLRGRPLTLKRYPDGIKGESFFQKQAPDGIPGWVKSETLPTGSGSRREQIRYLICDNESTLVYLANLACISHNPWISSLPELDKPDVIVFDLDPVDPEDFAACVETAFLIRDKLAVFGLRGYAKTSGATGIHVYVPVEPRYSYEHTRSFAKAVAILCREEQPELVTIEQPIERRAGSRVYIDFLQNSRGRTLASVYSVRAREGAPVSTPVTWSELRHGLKPSDFRLPEALARFKDVGDLFAPVLTDRQDLLAAIEQGGQFLDAGQS